MDGTTDKKAAPGRHSTPRNCRLAEGGECRKLSNNMKEVFSKGRTRVARVNGRKRYGSLPASLKEFPPAELCPTRRDNFGTKRSGSRPSASPVLAACRKHLCSPATALTAYGGVVDTQRRETKPVKR